MCASVMDECNADVNSLDDTIVTNTVTTNSLQNGDVGEECLQLHSLYEKYKIQEKEIERLEEQNSEYREKLLKAVRERDSNDELLRNVRDAQKKETSELEKHIRDYEIQLKAVQDRASAQEAHYNVTIKDLSLKYNTSVSQLTKKLDISEKEKNDAVVKYATKEAEIMRIRGDIQKKEQELLQCQKAKEELEHCQRQENVENLEKTNSSLRVELEHAKQEKLDLENKLKIAEKRTETCNATVAELKQQCDVLRKQLIQMKEEKGQLQEENRNLSLRTQIQESRRAHENEELSRSQHLAEQQLAEANSNCARLTECNREINTRLEELKSENLDLLNKLQDLEDKLSLVEEAHAKVSVELCRLQGIEKKVLSSQEMAERAKTDKEQAEKEREIAEKEAEECRLQAERVLAITEQLTQRNSQLVSEAAAEKEKNCCLEQQLVATEGSLNCALLKLSEREKDLEQATGSGESEITSLKDELNDKLVEVQKLTQRIQEERADHDLLKKKYIAQIKELKHELSSLRKQVDANSTAPLAPPNSNDSLPSTNSRSRASSMNSLDRITTLSRDEDNTHPGQTVSSEPSAMQQVMIDKIIVLQKKLARRNDKIEFLEEHVRCCLEELQKKTRIIQHYALREEASLLLPSDGSLEQVPLSRKGASYSLMGSIFAGGNDKKSLQLATEVNSRLQAVLEDILMKNITLKGSLDSLSNEVSKLSRENRQLTLLHSRCSEQRP